jgi:hypothetical protein
MLCTKDLYAPGASRANMGYDVDELDKTASGVHVCWCDLPVCHQIETCPDVAFPCCVKKGSEIRRVQYARCYVRYLRLRVNISAYRFYRLSMQFSVRAVDNRNRQVLSALRLRKN